MGILELHFHDSELSWHFAPGTGRERSFSLGTGGESKTATNGGGETRPSMLSKLRSLAVLALVVGGGVAYNRMKARRREQAEQDAESSGRRLSLSRSK